MTSPVVWVAKQLERTGVQLKPGVRTRRLNPRPAGVMLEGSATHAVLLALQKSPQAWLTHAQLLHRTQRSTKSVCWAVLYLEALGLIEWTPDDGRNARYRRYRAVGDGLGKGAGA